MVEAHHAQKKDAPSGTALTLGDAAAAAPAPRSNYASLRAGDIVGEHTVQFSGPGKAHWSGPSRRQPRHLCPRRPSRGLAHGWQNRQRPTGCGICWTERPSRRGHKKEKTAGAAGHSLSVQFPLACYPPPRTGEIPSSRFLQPQVGGAGFLHPKANPVTQPAILVLEDGTVFEGESVGATGLSAGEVVFNTAMTGYQEVLTDPSYARQLVTLTYPHVGNTGCTDQDDEARQVWSSGLIVRDVPRRPSSWRNQQALPEWLAQRGVVAIAGIDTRKLTRILRDRGAQNGALMAGEHRCR